MQVGGAHAWGGGPVSITMGSTRILHAGRTFSTYSHGFSANGRHYAYVARGYRVLVDVERAVAAP